MNTNEFRQAFEIADSDDDLTGVDVSPFDGFGLPDFEPVVVSVRQVAALMRWQALYIYCRNSEDRYDMEALNQIRRFGRKRFCVVDSGKAGAK